MNECLAHHGILGQKWGYRNGPPYPLSGGDYSKEELRKVYNQRSLKPNSLYNKKHFDDIIKADKDTLTTLSHDPNRMKGTDMFFAAYDKMDKHQYNALFNRKAPRMQYDKDGNEIGTGMFLKYRINQNAKSDIKVASEDSGANVFKNLYNKDRDFYNFVTQRMTSLYPKDKYLFKGYRESMDTIKAVANGKKPTESDVAKMYRLFNYVLPNDGGGDQRIAKDVLTQRTKFFNALKKEGYGAVLDTNDAIYGGFKAKKPVIVFDMDNVISNSIKQTNILDKRVSQLALAGRKALGGVI